MKIEMKWQPLRPYIKMNKKEVAQNKKSTTMKSINRGSMLSVYA